MKKISYIILLAFAGIFLLSCEKDEDKVMISANPTASALATLPAFTDFNLDNTASELDFAWTATDFGYKAAITYTIQVDSAGKEFANAINVYTTEELSATLTVGEFNKALQDGGYEDYDVDHSMEMRIKASVSSLYESTYSESGNYTVAPFATEFPPIYMVGAALGGWDWTLDVEMRSSAPKVYQTIAYFSSDAGADATFRFFAQADWGPTSYNYPYFTTVDPLFEDAMDGDNNLRFLGANGYYDITCDLKTATVSITAVDEPIMYMTGQALGGWDWTTNNVQMTWVSNGVFEATTDFENDTFRFFAQADWSPTSYNYPYFVDGEVDALFEDALDGDNNFRFIGVPGSYKVTINLLDNIVTMESAK